VAVKLQLETLAAAAHKDAAAAKLPQGNWFWSRRSPDNIRSLQKIITMQAKEAEALAAKAAGNAMKQLRK